MTSYKNYKIEDFKAIKYANDAVIVDEIEFYCIDKDIIKKLIDERTIYDEIICLFDGIFNNDFLTYYKISIKKIRHYYINRQFDKATKAINKIVKECEKYYDENGEVKTSILYLECLKVRIIEANKIK